MPKFNECDNKPSNVGGARNVAQELLEAVKLVQIARALLKIDGEVPAGKARAFNVRADALLAKFPNVHHEERFPKPTIFDPPPFSIIKHENLSPRTIMVSPDLYDEIKKQYSIE